MFATTQQKAAAVANARAWLGTREPHEAAHLTELIQAESNFDPEAQSGTGASGIAQFVRGTWAQASNFALRNIPQSEWPPGITPENIGDYDGQNMRPLAGTFMAWANLKRLESRALSDANSRRLRAGLPDATSLLQAFEGNTGQWSTVVATGHKDGAERMQLFLSPETGAFDTAPAQEFYAERNARFQAEADDLTARARAAEASGQNGQATTLFRQAQRRRNSDSTGHVFGYATRIADQVSEATGQEPVAYTQAELVAFDSLSLPGQSENNPARRVFSDRIVSGRGLAPPVGAATPDEPNILERALGEGLELLVPEARADTSLAAGAPVVTPGNAAGDVGRSVRAGVGNAAGTVADTAGSAGRGIRDFFSDGLDNIRASGRNIVDGVAGAAQRDRLRAAQSEAEILQGAVDNPDAVDAFRDGVLNTEGVAAGQLAAAVANVDALIAEQAGGTPNVTADPVPPAGQGGDPLVNPPTAATGVNPSELPADQQSAQSQARNAELDFLESNRINEANELLARAQFDEQAGLLRGVSGARQAQLEQTDLALLGLAFAPEIDLGSGQGALGSIIPTGNPFEGGAPSGELFSGLGGGLDVSQPGVRELGALADFRSAQFTGAFQRQAEADTLDAVATADPLAGAILRADQSQGINPFFDMVLNDQIGVLSGLTTEQAEEARLRSQLFGQLSDGQTQNLILNSPNSAAITRDVGALIRGSFDRSNAENTIRGGLR